MHLMGGTGSQLPTFEPVEPWVDSSSSISHGYHWILSFSSPIRFYTRWNHPPTNQLVTCTTLLFNKYQLALQADSLCLSHILEVNWSYNHFLWLYFPSICIFTMANLLRVMANTSGKLTRLYQSSIIKENKYIIFFSPLVFSKFHSGFTSSSNNNNNNNKHNNQQIYCTYSLGQQAIFQFTW